MAQSVYDPDSDEKRVHHDAPDPLEQLRNEEKGMEDRAYSGAADDMAAERGLSGGGDEGSRYADAAKEKGSGGDSGNSGSRDSLYNKDGDQQTGLRGRAQNARNRVKSKVSSLSKNKWLVGVGIGGASTVGIIVIVLVLIAGALKIPNLAQNVLDYQFTRVAREFADSADTVTESSLDEEALDSTSSNILKVKYTAAKKGAGEMWGKLDNYRPNKVIQNLGDADSGGMKLKFVNNRFVGGSLNGSPFTLTQQGKTRFVPGLNGAISFKNELNFSRDFAPALEEQLKVNEVGPIVRSIAANRIRKQLGISLVAWQVGKYQGKNAAQSRIQETKDKETAVDGGEAPPVVEGTTSSLNEDEEAAAKAAEEELSTDAGIQAVINNGGVSQKAKDAIANGLKTSKLDVVLGAADPLASIIPACIVYDGSLDSSGPVIDEQVRQSQGAFYYLESAADQEKYGSTGSDVDNDGLASAIGATNDDLGSIEQSIAYNRANGANQSTNSIIGPEASAEGDFTLVDAIPGLPSSAASILDLLGNHVCKHVTSLQAQGALSLALILSQFIPGPDLVEDGGVAGVKTAGTEITSDIIEKEGGNLAQRLLVKFTNEKTASYSTKAGNILFDSGKSAGKIVAETLLAKLIVNSRAGQMDNGTTQGTDLANEADVGGNLHANELARTQNFGRPLTQPEVCQSKQDDLNELSYENSQKSAFQRYLSTSNPTSMLSQTAIDVSANMDTSLASKLFKLGTDILHPSVLFSSFSQLLLGHGYAASNCDNASTDYGNVQFGWSDDEEKLMHSDDSYTPLANQQILDNSGQEASIAKAYANCFGYTYDPNGDGSFDPTDDSSDIKLAIAGSDTSGSLGTLLSNGEILRDSTGNVIGSQTDGDNGAVNPHKNSCSPGNLSYDNNTYDAQMVFRFRLAERYFVTVDTMTNEQIAPSSSDQTGGTSP